MSRQGSAWEKRGVVLVAVTTDRPGEPKPRWVRPCAEIAPPPAGVPMSREWGRIVAKRLQARYDAPGGWSPWDERPAPGAPTLPAATRETVGAYFDERWHPHRLRALPRSARGDRYRFDKHVRPLLGAHPIATVGPAALEAVRDALDAKVAAGALSGKSAMNVWAVLTTLFRDAHRAKPTTGLRVRADNPAAGLAPPEKTDERQGPCLFGDERAALLACPAVDGIFPGLRRLLAFHADTGLRASEAEALGVADVDLEHDVLHVHRAADYQTGAVRECKSVAAVRWVPLEASVRPLVAALVVEARAAGRTRLLPAMPDRRRGAELVRAALRAAGLTRADLFADDDARRPMGWHDLRASYVTARLVRGDDAAAVCEQAGHESLSTTRGYQRTARALGGRFGAYFTPVPADVVGAAEGPAATTVATSARRAGYDRAETTARSGVRGRGVEPHLDATPDDGPRHSAGSSTDAAQPATPGGQPATGVATAVATLTPYEQLRASEAVQYAWAERAILADLDAAERTEVGDVH